MFYDYEIKNIEIIDSITVSNGITIGNEKFKSIDDRLMEGYKISLSNDNENTRFIFILIDSETRCCESYGYIESEDDISKFIGAKFDYMKITDNTLNTKILNEIGKFENEDEFYTANAKFVDFYTNKGNFQLAIYNAHNGYYGHQILILDTDTNYVLNDNI